VHVVIMGCGRVGSALARSLEKLGHSVAVAERHYLNVHRGIPRDSRTLEAAMQLEDAELVLVAQAELAPDTTKRRLRTI